ncbi:MAG: hypothetical protein M1827_001476 [Pycnora praestabilis]|nr:MAG: hypothetical protein M1827_001476 [Pycnora praestabilis]
MSTAQEEIDALFNQSEKFSHHPEDSHTSSESDPCSDIEEDGQYHDLDKEDDEDELYTSSTMPSRTKYHLPLTQFDANTGPKGVIADAQSFEEAKKKGTGNRAVRRIIGSGGFGNSNGHQSKEARSSSYGSVKESSSLEPGESDQDDEDDEFLEKWRRMRVDQLSVQLQDPRTRKVSPSKRQYGRVVTVDAVGYLNAVDNVARDTVVVVCIFDDQSDTSHLVDDCILTLAQKHPTTRFVRLSYSEAEMDPLSAPGILAYRNGEIFANLVALIHQMPEGRDLSSSSLELVLKQ